MLLAVLVGMWPVLSPLGDDKGQRAPDERFEHLFVDRSGLNDPWGKAVGDINGDGLPDIVVGAHKPAKRTIWERLLVKLKIKDASNLRQGELVWYANPHWEKHLVSDRDRFRTDHEVADIDGDGRNDIVALGDAGMAWFKNPDWSATLIDPQKLHDVEIADLDGDGDIDIVARNQSLFNYNNGNQLHFYRQDSPTRWDRFTVPCPTERGSSWPTWTGMEHLDVVVTGYWYQNPGRLFATATGMRTPTRQAGIWRMFSSTRPILMVTVSWTSFWRPPSPRGIGIASPG